MLKKENAFLMHLFYDRVKAFHRTSENHQGSQRYGKHVDYQREDMCFPLGLNQLLE